MPKLTPSAAAAWAHKMQQGGDQKVELSKLKELHCVGGMFDSVDKALVVQLRSLLVLDLRDNSLQDGLELIEAIRPLTSHLQELDVRGNPLLGDPKNTTGRTARVRPKSAAVPRVSRSPSAGAATLDRISADQAGAVGNPFEEVGNPFESPTMDGEDQGNDDEFETEAAHQFHAMVLRTFPLLRVLDGRAVLGGVMGARVSRPKPVNPSAAPKRPTPGPTSQSSQSAQTSPNPATAAVQSWQVSDSSASSARQTPALPPKRASVILGGGESGTDAKNPQASASSGSTELDAAAEVARLLKEDSTPGFRLRTSTSASDLQSASRKTTPDEIFTPVAPEAAKVSNRKSAGPIAPISIPRPKPATSYAAPILPKKVDIHGFGVHDACIEAYEQYISTKHETRSQRGREAWDKLIANVGKVKLHSGIDIYETVSFHERKRLRHLILDEGVPLEHCASLWLVCSGAMAKKRSADLNSESGAYLKEMLTKCGRDRALTEGASAGGRPTSRRGKVLAEIQRDTFRTFRSHYRMTQTTLSQLEHLLEAYARRNKALGYCQSMNYVVAWSLIVCGGVQSNAHITIGRGDDYDESSFSSAVIPGMGSPSSLPLGEQSFWLLSTLVEDLLPGFWSRTMTSLHVTYRVVNELVQRQLPAMHEHLNELSVSLPLVITRWVLNLFTDTLPSETCRHVWSALFVEVLCASGGAGARDVTKMQPNVASPNEAALHFVYRVCFALLYAAEPAVLEAEDAIAACGALERVGMMMFDWKALLRASVVDAPIGNIKDAVKNTVSGKEGRPVGSLAGIDIPTDDVLRHLRHVHAHELHHEVQEIRQKKDVQELSQITHFTPEEIESLRLQFRFLARQKMQHSNCTVRDSVNMSFEQFSSAVTRSFNAARGATSEGMLRKLFAQFDENGDGRVDFREMILGLSTLTHGGIEERLRLLFNAMVIEASDRETDSISQEDLALLLRGVFKQVYTNADGVGKKTSVDDFVDHVFKNLDSNGDGRLTFEEFKKISVLESQIVEALLLTEPKEDLGRFTEVLEKQCELPAWEPDNARDECPVCGERFAILTKRKHHCRRCGRVVCGTCSRHNIRIRGAGDDPVRVCNTCAQSFGEIRPPAIISLTHPNSDVSLP